MGNNFAGEAFCKNRFDFKVTAGKNVKIKKRNHFGKWRIVSNIIIFYDKTKVARGKFAT